MRGDPPSSGGNRDPEDLLAAYVDGVSELTPEERRRIEAARSSPELRADEAATRELIGQLRELPREGNEPDWSALERSIHEAVGPTVPRRWWRTWRLVFPGLAVAAAAAIAVIVTRPSEPVPVVVLDEPALVMTPHADEPVPAVYLDGTGVELDLDLHADDVLDDPFADLQVDEIADDFFIAEDIAWIDGLDEASLAQLERWLESEDNG